MERKIEWWQVKALRKSFDTKYKKMSQVEFARLIGVSPLSIVRWENQKFKVSKMGEKLIRNFAKEKEKSIPRLKRREYAWLWKRKKT